MSEKIEDKSWKEIYLLFQQWVLFFVVKMIALIAICYRKLLTKKKGG